MTAELRVFESHADRPLDASGIEADLASLWKEATASAGEPAMRASRANLVVVPWGSPNRSDAVEPYLPEIARSFPSRVIVARPGGEAPQGALRASVSALCTLGEKARYVCCETIRIEVGRGAEPAVPAAVMALVCGDLPIVLWAPGDVPEAEEWFGSLLAASDRLVIDSSQLSAPAEQLGTLSHATAGFTRVRIADFEWPRLIPWRRAIADAFDPDPLREVALGGLDRVTFFETPARGTSGRRPHQGILADERPGEATASAPSLLLKAWLMKKTRVRTFSWSPSAPSAAVRADTARGVDRVLFEAVREGSPITVDVGAPSAGVLPGSSDLVRALGGQEDNPLAEA